MNVPLASFYLMPLIFLKGKIFWPKEREDNVSDRFANPESVILGRKIYYCVTDWKCFMLSKMKTKSINFQTQNQTKSGFNNFVQGSLLWNFWALVVQKWTCWASLNIKPIRSPLISVIWQFRNVNVICYNPS